MLAERSREDNRGARPLALLVVVTVPVGPCAWPCASSSSVAARTSTISMSNVSVLPASG